MITTTSADGTSVHAVEQGQGPAILIVQLGPWGSGGRPAGDHLGVGADQDGAAGADPRPSSCPFKKTRWDNRPLSVRFRTLEP